ncbi:MAG: 3'-5' exonuclease [Rikenellaceae bacterium]|nr:3'-5' exonuclease [Rikenellaceae bacterium]MCL2691849.1 3'-5' exonuclease [Rikenellaceae bacterium]
MKLNLKKPIVFLDLETTGVDPAKDRIVEISLVKLHPGGEREVKTRRINPGVPIPPQATAIHGISDADVSDQPTFPQIAKSLAAFIEGADLAGYNSNKFDIPLLAEEFLRAGVDIDLKKRRAIDVQNIFHKMEQRTLAAAYRLYCDKELEGAHSAEADTLATLEVLEAQLERYGEELLRNDVEALAEFSTMNRFADYAGRVIYDERGVEVFGFGKHKGRAVSEVFRDEPSYYSWMMSGDFPEYTKKVITEIRLRDAMVATKTK